MKKLNLKKLKNSIQLDYVGSTATEAYYAGLRLRMPNRDVYETLMSMIEALEEARTLLALSGNDMFPNYVRKVNKWLERFEDE